MTKPILILAFAFCGFIFLAYLLFELGCLWYEIVRRIIDD